jgi:DNA (cytosine-5)-methyltransferase 1
MKKTHSPSDESLRVAGFFAGIGGIELGLERAGHRTELLCENDPAAKVVLARWFPHSRIEGDVRYLRALPRVDLITAGFPCQDLSQAGATNGINGRKSGIVKRLLKLIEAQTPTRRPAWVLIENVPFMLQLAKGQAIKYLTDRLSDLGYTWAYRTMDTRAFGLPHRRRRVFLLASRVGDPRGVLLSSDRGELDVEPVAGHACGFYWTEGNRGLGWAVDAIPPLKGSSGLGIPSPPGMWMPDGRMLVPDIRDAERLQGFKSNWTKPALDHGGTMGTRWRLVGNAVSVPISEWIGSRLRTTKDYDPSDSEVMMNGSRWPNAAWGRRGKAYRIDVSAWPVRRKTEPLQQFLRYPARPLSAQAACGFLVRLKASKLRVDKRFMDDLAAYVARMRDPASSKARMAPSRLPIRSK